MTTKPLINLVADAVVRGLNSTQFSTVGANQSVVFERVNIPLYDLEKVGPVPLGFVTPRGKSIELLTRKHTSDALTIDIGLMRRVSRADQEIEVDQMRTLVEEVIDRMTMFEFDEADTDLANVRWTETENDPFVVPEHLREHGVFTSVVSVTFDAAVTRRKEA